MTMIPVGPYSPDTPETNAGVSANIANVVVHKDETGVAYGPCPSISLASTATALASQPLGGTSVLGSTGTYSTYVGTIDHIYHLNSDFTWTSIGAGYAVTANEKWSMIGFGDNLLATNTTDGLFSYNTVTPAGVSAVTNSFKPRVIWQCFDCVFGADTLDASGTRDPRLFRNSAINDFSEWRPSISGAGYQEAPDGGEVMGGLQLTDNFGVVFQRNAVLGLTRTSDGSIYSKKTIAVGVGAVNPYCFVVVGSVAYFVDVQGIKSVSLGQYGPTISPIGLERVNQAWVNSLGSVGLKTVEAVVDLKYERVIFRFQRYDCASQTIFEDALAYHYMIDAFVPLKIQTAALLNLASSAYDMDSMATLFPDMDAMTTDMDSSFWNGGTPQLFGIDGNLKGGFFSGPALAATMETGSIATGTSNLVRALRPVTDASAATVAIGHREAVYGTKVYSGEYPIMPSGIARVRGRGKVLSARATIPAGATWTFFRGFDDVEMTAGGAR